MDFEKFYPKTATYNIPNFKISYNKSFDKSTGSDVFTISDDSELIPVKSWLEDIVSAGEIKLPENNT